MVDTVAWNKCKVPNYWLAVEPTLAHDKIPHNYNGNVPSEIASGQRIVPEGGLLVDAGGDPTNAQSGTPGFFYPLGTNEADLAALKANVDIGTGTGPTDDPWDTTGQYIVLEDGSECHYRLDDWQVGRVP